MTSNAEAIASFLDAKGLTDAQIAGILGNLKVESGFSPTAYNPGERAIGIAQWEGPRRTALQRFAAARGSTETSLTTQLQFMWAELTGSESRAFGKLKATATPAAAAAAWDQFYERSSGEARAQRITYAGQFADALGAGPDSARAQFVQVGLGDTIGEAAGRVGGAAKGAAEGLLDKGKDLGGAVTDLPGKAAGKLVDAIGSAAGNIGGAIGNALVGVVTSSAVRDAATRTLAVLTGVGLLWVGVTRISAPARDKVRATALDTAAAAAAPETGGASLAAAGAAKGGT